MHDALTMGIGLTIPTMLACVGWLFRGSLTAFRGIESRLTDIEVRLGQLEVRIRDAT